MSLEWVVLVFFLVFWDCFAGFWGLYIKKPSKKTSLSHKNPNSSCNGWAGPPGSSAFTKSQSNAAIIRQVRPLAGGEWAGDAFGWLLGSVFPLVSAKTVVKLFLFFAFFEIGFWCCFCCLG